MNDKTEFLNDLHPLLTEFEQAIQHLKKSEEEYEVLRLQFRSVDRQLDLARDAVLQYYDVLTTCLEKGIDPTQAKLLASLKTKDDPSVFGSISGMGMGRVTAAPPMMTTADMARNDRSKQSFTSRLLRFFKSK